MRVILLVCRLQLKDSISEEDVCSSSGTERDCVGVFDRRRK